LPFTIFYLFYFFDAILHLQFAFYITFYCFYLYYFFH